MVKKQRILVDMDGVLSNIYEQFKRFEFEDTGVLISQLEAHGKTEQEAFANSLKHIVKKGFWRTIPVMPKAIETLRELNKKHEIFIVSSAMEYPNSLAEKYYWMEEHFPYISWKQLVFCGSKTMAKGDIMIDDHFKNLDYFEGRTLLFSQPHNFGMENHSHKRVDSWDEISEILL
jgi:5'-nucleotidase